MKRAFACAIGLFFCIVLPWFGGAVAASPDFPYYGIMKNGCPLYHHRISSYSPFYYYAPIIAGTFFAWSLLLPEAIVVAWQERKRWSRADRLLVVWAIVVVLFFSVSQSKLPGYILTAVVALAF